MCYHTSSPSKAQLKDKFPEKKVIYPVDEEIYHVSGFTRPYLPVTLNEHAEEIRTARWKLIPFWVKTEEEANKYANTLNAAAESVFEKASYKHYIEKHRGLLYVNGFYEPHYRPGQKSSDNYFIYKPNKEIFTLGIVYADFSDLETGETYPTYSIITTDANPLLAEIHNTKKRMPLIISEEDREAWLFSNDKEEIHQLMIPYSGDLEAHQVLRVTGGRADDSNQLSTQQKLNFDA